MWFRFSWPAWAKWYQQPDFLDFNMFASHLNDRNKRTASPSTERITVQRSNTSERITAQRSNTTDYATSILSGNGQNIPPKLSLERILKNRTCSPMSLTDFYMYLKHIEFSPENLEFYAWFQDYKVRYSKKIGVVGPCVFDEATLNGNDGSACSLTDAGSSWQHILRQKPSFSACSKFSASTINPFDAIELETRDTHADTITYIANLITRTAPCALPTFKKQRSRGPLKSGSNRRMTLNEELAAIAELFLTPDSPKELNIPFTMRKKALKAISVSADPVSLEPIAEHVYAMLRSCSHRNFVHHGVSNGTFETVCVATGLGIFLTAVGFLTMFLLAFASPSYRQSSRWRGLGVIPFWSIGVSLIASGLRGSCFFLLLFSRRQALPWERLGDSASVRSGPFRFLNRLMILDRKIQVKDINLRNLQKRIVLQSLLTGATFTTVMVAFFLCLPIWKEDA